MFCFCLLFLLDFFRLHMHKLTKYQAHITKTKKQTNKKRRQINTNIGHPPAHHPTANEYLSGSGWMSCICVFSFLEVFVFFFCLFCFCIVFLSFCMYKQQNSSNNKTQLKPQKNKQTQIQLIQPEPERYFFVVEWSAGCPVFFRFLLFISKVFCCFCCGL